MAQSATKEILAATLAEQQAILHGLQGKQVEGRTLEENLRITEGNIARRERAVARIREEGIELQDQLVVLQAKMAKLQSEFTTKFAELERDKADRARLLARKASEAAAGLPAETGQPAVPAPVAPTAQGLFNAVAALPGFGDPHLQALRGIWEALQLQMQPLPAVAVLITSLGTPCGSAGPA